MQSSVHMIHSLDISIEMELLMSQENLDQAFGQVEKNTSLQQTVSLIMS